MLTSIVLGAGEVGKSLYAVLNAVYPSTTFIRDKRYDVETITFEDFNVLHICFPFDRDFKSAVYEYRKEYSPDYVVIHSSVPVGTTRALRSSGINCFHSPIRGIHPKLAEGITTFTKYLAPVEDLDVDNVDNVDDLVRHFERAGISIRLVAKSETTELGKLASTTRFGLDIAFEKFLHAECKRVGADFNTVYTDFTNTYNTGYAKLRQRRFIRPVLSHMPGVIGGHCVANNLKLMQWEGRMTSKSRSEMELVCALVDVYCKYIIIII